MAFSKKISSCANRCYVTVDYLAQLNRALSGNLTFNGKYGENIYWTLEIPLAYNSPFPIMSMIHKIYIIYSENDDSFDIKDGRDTDTTDFMLQHQNEVSDYTVSTCNAC